VLKLWLSVPAVGSVVLVVAVVVFGVAGVVFEAAVALVSDLLALFLACTTYQPTKPMMAIITITRILSTTAKPWVSDFIRGMLFLYLDFNTYAFTVIERLPNYKHP
jgi:hypothetical protein